MKCDCKMIFVTKRKPACKIPVNVKSKEYLTWVGIRARANPSKQKRLHKTYWGIKISAEWANSFHVFFKDMGPRPDGPYSIDRIVNRRGYCKHNCRWATKLEQIKNRDNITDRGMPLGVIKRSSGRYSARINIRGKVYWLGTYKTVSDAQVRYLAVKNMAIKDYQKFSKYFVSSDTDLF